MELESITPDPTALRALSHPVRLRILGMLRADGPATASTLATQLALNSGATSYHLRQLALHGFIVDVPERGNGRDRWWRAAHQATRTEKRPSGPDERDAEDAFSQAVAVIHTEQLQRAVEERPLLPADWRAASTLSDWSLVVTAARAEQLTEALIGFVESWDEDDDDPAAEQYMVVLHTYPRPGRLAVPELAAET